MGKNAVLLVRLGLVKFDSPPGCFQIVRLLQALDRGLKNDLLETAQQTLAWDLLGCTAVDSESETTEGNDRPESPTTSNPTNTQMSGTQAGGGTNELSPGTTAILSQVAALQAVVMSLQEQRAGEGGRVVDPMDGSLCHSDFICLEQPAHASFFFTRIFCGWFCIRILSSDWFINVDLKPFAFGTLFYATGKYLAAASLMTYALYNKSKKVISLFCVLNIAAVLFFVVQAALLTSSSKDNLPVATFKPLPLSLNSSIYWAPFLLNEMVTFSLAVVRNAKTERSLNLTRTLIRDNMIYFSVIFIVYASGLFLLIDLKIEETYAGTFTLASIAVSGILAPNLLLMLKKGYYNQGQDIKLATDISTFHV
ncbi:hypothetical protein ACEPAF_989 [Sanghuangporus sanghuang]